MSDKEKHPGGRPPLYKTPEELEALIIEYFNSRKPRLKIIEGEQIKDSKGNCIYEFNPPTISGLAYHLGFASRQSIYDNEKRNDQFSYIIKRARLMCEDYAETMLLSGVSPASYIFWLKNHEWTDRQELTGKDGSDLFSAFKKNLMGE